MFALYRWLQAIRGCKPCLSGHHCGLCACCYP